MADDSDYKDEWFEGQGALHFKFAPDSTYSTTRYIVPRRLVKGGVHNQREHAKLRRETSFQKIQYQDRGASMTIKNPAPIPQPGIIHLRAQSGAARLNLKLRVITRGIPKQGRGYIAVTQSTPCRWTHWRTFLLSAKLSTRLHARRQKCLHMQLLYEPPHIKARYSEENLTWFPVPTKLVVVKPLRNVVKSSAFEARLLISY